MPLPSSPVLLSCLVATLLAGCAPKAEPARGDLAEQVRSAIENGTETFDHTAWDDLLAQGTLDGMVDYELFRHREDELDSYLETLADARLDTLSRDELMALLINAYNAYTIRSILDHPGIDSIREIDGVWDTRTHRVGGFDLTLDNIEHNLLRPFFKDPRIHMAVNCASRSCAPLPPWAFEGSRLEQQLDQWTRAFFDNAKYSRLEGDTYRLSKLLEWYGDDFLKADAEPRADSLIEFAIDHTAGELHQELSARREELRIEFLDYDWALNRAATSGAEVGARP